jgi:hypothetical protein
LGECFIQLGDQTFPVARVAPIVAPRSHLKCIVYIR